MPPRVASTRPTGSLRAARIRRTEPGRPGEIATQRRGPEAAAKRSCGSGSLRDPPSRNGRGARPLPFFTQRLKNLPALSPLAAIHYEHRVSGCSDVTNPPRASIEPNYYRVWHHPLIEQYVMV